VWSERWAAALVARFGTAYEHKHRDHDAAAPHQNIQLVKTSRA